MFNTITLFVIHKRLRRQTHACDARRRRAFQALCVPLVNRALHIQVMIFLLLERVMPADASALSETSCIIMA